MNGSGGILESACLSVLVSALLYVYVQNTTFCQCAGGGFNSLPNDKILD